MRQHREWTASWVLSSLEGCDSEGKARTGPDDVAVAFVQLGKMPGPACDNVRPAQAWDSADGPPSRV
jgi:hypothetical protein